MDTVDGTAGIVAGSGVAAVSAAGAVEAAGSPVAESGFGAHAKRVRRMIVANRTRFMTGLLAGALHKIRKIQSRDLLTSGEGALDEISPLFVQSPSREYSNKKSH
jgi:hypothetical protein